MSEKIQVPADMQEICFIFEDSSCEHRSYLDVKTGGIIQILDDITDLDEKEELDDKVEDFIETVKEVKLKEKLYNAIARKGAFRRFKDVLNSYPKERERWFKFKDEKVMERVNEWLEMEGIEIIPQKPIAIREITLRETSESKEIEESWKLNFFGMI
jgi:hypothetical protein